MNKFKKTLIMTVISYFVLNFILKPNVFISSAQNAIILCINSVIPSLFPFFIVSNMLIHFGIASSLSKYLSCIMKPLFNVNGSGAVAVILGIVSGFPIGASVTVELYKKGLITKTEGERLLSFTNCAGPVFIYGVIGCIFLSSAKLGLVIYISHIISSLITGFIFKFYKKDLVNKTYILPETSFKDKKNFKNFGISITESINSSVDSILKVCAFITFFSVITVLIPKFNLYPYIYSLIEITGGIAELSKLNLDKTLLIPIITFFLSLSGLSVIFQVSSIISPAGFSLKTYILGNIFKACFSFFISKIILIFYEPYPIHSVFAPIYKNLLTENIWISSLGISFFSLVILILLLILGYTLETRKK